jgi:anti-sigma regulatory factor (Ser/Thr protein kinase)
MIEYRLVEWGLTATRYSDVRSNLQLIAAELVTNAARETPDRDIRVQCFPDFNASAISIAVWDASDRKPEPAMPLLTQETLDLRPSHFDDNGGWGLPLVQALAESCGVEPTKHGKWVWATIKVGG